MGFDYWCSRAKGFFLMDTKFKTKKEEVVVLKIQIEIEGRGFI